MLTKQHATRPSVSTRELTKIFLSVLMITGAISFAYAMGGGTTTSPAATQSSEAAGAASATVAADTGTAEMDHLYRVGHIDATEHAEAMEWVEGIGGTTISLWALAAGDLEPFTKGLFILIAFFGTLTTGLAKAL